MPDFLIIGAQKSGTTSLYQYLTRHPQILPAPEKEIHFFDLHYARGIDWYLSQFPAKTNPPPFEGGGAIVTGESSPYYIFHPWVPQRVKQLFPEIKLIVLLRDPVERTWSHYHHEVRYGFETLGFEAALEREAQRLAGEWEKLRSDPNYYSYNHQHYTYLSRGRYIEQLQRWMEHFPRERFLILNSEDFYANPSTNLSQTLEFLGLSSRDLGEYDRYNIGEYPPISDKIRQKLVNYFIPYNLQLYEYLQVNWNWSSVNQRVKMESKKQGGVDYEGAWDNYAGAWQNIHPQLQHIGDEWIGKGAGAAKSLAEYEALIEAQFIQPYIDKDDVVLEVGVGGGKTSKLLKKHCDELICADISSQMLEATRSRLGDRGISYIKLDGLSLTGIAPNSVDVCFCYDTMVHIEPRDIFNYLNQIPHVMRGKRLCVFHHTNILGDLGWQKFLSEWQNNLLGQRDGCAFSVMTDNIMEKFLTNLNYEIILKDTQSVPRDCIWVCKAPILS